MARIPIDKKIGIEKLVDLNSKSTFSKILSQIGWMDPKQKEKSDMYAVSQYRKKVHFDSRN